MLSVSYSYSLLFWLIHSLWSDAIAIGPGRTIHASLVGLAAKAIGLKLAHIIVNAMYVLLKHLYQIVYSNCIQKGYLPVHILLAHTSRMSSGSSKFTSLVGIWTFFIAPNSIEPTMTLSKHYVFSWKICSYQLIRSRQCWMTKCSQPFRHNDSCVRYENCFSPLLPVSLQLPVWLTAYVEKGLQVEMCIKFQQE